MADAKRQTEVISCEQAARRLDREASSRVSNDVREEYEHELAHAMLRADMRRASDATVRRHDREATLTPSKRGG
jgi:hypothetical protein